MKSKTGIVMEIKGNIAYIMTPSGEFERIKIRYKKPSIGAIYTGEVYKKSNSIKYFVSAASVFLCVALAGSSYAYYKPVNSIVVKINDTGAKIQINKFNKIIKVSTIKQESDNVIKSLKLKHKDINDGLTKIVDASKGTNNNHNLFVEIETNTKIESKIDIAKFEENMQKESIDYAIDKKAEDDKKVKVEVRNNLNAETETVNIDEEITIESNNSIKDSNDNTKDKTINNNKEENSEVNVKNKVKNETSNNNIKNNVTKENKEAKKNNKKDTNQN